MKTLAVALLCLFSASSAFANSETNKNALQLVKRIELKQKRFKRQLKVSQSLIKVLQPDIIRQGDAYSVYFQSNTEITGTNSLIDLTIDGNPAALEQPAQGLFIYHSGGESEIKIHNAVAKLSIEDTAEAKSLRDAINQLDIEIAALQDQIDEMEPGEEQDALILQRDEKVAIKNQLVAALAAIKTPIGEEAFTIRIVAAASNNPNFFRIISVSPSFGPVEGGTELTITGQRFPSGMEAILGGVTLPVTHISPTEVKVTTPDFTASGGVGIKSIELRLPPAAPGEPVKNATRANVFFAASIVAPPEENVKPVAVAGASQSANVGTEVTISGASSYDQNVGDTLTYSWKAISVPAGSGINTGVVHATTQGFNFTPSKPGSYVWELIVNDGELDSEPSLTVVTANPPANTAPAPTADGISLAIEDSATSQIAHGDVDDYQAHSYRIIKQSSFGTASVSSTGLVSFTAGSAGGSDTIDVLVMDNGNPPLSSVVSIPVTVVASVVNLDDLYFNTIARDGLITVQLGADTITTTNGEIVSAVWNFGDGTSQPSLTPADAFVTHDYLAAGTYTATLTVTDSWGSTDTATQTVVIGTSGMPVGKISASAVTGSVPLTVTFDASASSDDVGITNYRWRWNDSTSDTSTTSSTVTHTFNTAGTYRVRMRALDADGNRAETFVQIYAGTTPPGGGGSEPHSLINVGSREMMLTNAHSFSGVNSFDPNPSGSIVSYAWNFGDYLTCDDASPNPGCVASGATTTYTFPEAKLYSVSLEVEGALGRKKTTFKDVFAVNAGHAPRAVALPRLASGVAPLEVSLKGSGSFDYDGTLTYLWEFNDPACVTGCTSTDADATYTYSTEGIYQPKLTVTDSDGNRHESIVPVTVNPSLALNTKGKNNTKTASEDDLERERLRRELIERCVLNRHGQSCYEAGLMYQEDGNSFAAGKYFEKACAYGYEAACSIGNI
jgi:PKD repeat protein